MAATVTTLRKFTKTQPASTTVTAREFVDAQLRLAESIDSIVKILIALLGTGGGVGLTGITTAERDALPSPADGVVIYNTTDSQFQGRVAGAWVAL